MSLQIKLSRKPAIRITREALKYNNLVYIATANKKIKYKGGSSKIVYLGETSTGVKRITSSAADRAPQILNQHGFKNLEFFVVQPGKLQAVRTWEILERDLLIVFKVMFENIPIGNTQGDKIPYSALIKKFRREKLEKIIKTYSD
jgi:hypothetical protein